jgi:type IV pilus assembly protein PilZ
MARGKSSPREVDSADSADVLDDATLIERAPESGVEMAGDKLSGTNDTSGDVSDDACGVPSERGAAAQGAERRQFDRVDVEWSVDCTTEETFLYASIRNISTMGIFVQTRAPLHVGTKLTLRFAPPPRPMSPAEGPFVLQGTVQWVNDAPNSPNPGMGVRFTQLSSDDRSRIVEAIRTIAFVRDEFEPRLLN